MTYTEAAANLWRVKAQDILRARIEQMMRAQNLTPADLNRIVGLSKTWAYGYLKRGHDIPIDRLDRLAAGLSVTVPSLFDESELLAGNPQPTHVGSTTVDASVQLSQDPSNGVPQLHQGSEGSPMSDDLKNQLAGTLDIVPTKARKRFLEEVKDLAAGMRLKRPGHEGHSGKRLRKRRAG